MNTQIKATLSALIFSFLFYQKSFGLNLLLFSSLVAILLFLKENKPPLGYLATYFFTAIMVFLDPTGFKIFIHFMSFILLIGKQIAPKNAVYVHWFIGIINMLIASIFLLSDYLKKPDAEKKGVSPKVINSIKGIVISSFFLIVFSLLYKNANPVFETIIHQINLNFISFSWLFFTVMGYFVVLHILKPYHPEKLIAIESAQENNLKKPELPFETNQFLKLISEHTLGSFVLATLNILLVFYLITDAIYLLNSNQVSNAAYSASVHQGIYALLLSIICAIGIILYFFRGDLNFFEKNKVIKNLSYGWLLLNLILVLSTWFKNYTYVETLGLTYKRIGVFIYLLLVLFGLCTTYIKVARLKSFIFLIRTNVALWFVFLFLSSTIAWDRAITSYNLNCIQQPDISYLINLGDTNSFQLKKYAIQKSIKLPETVIEKITKKHQFKLDKNSKKSWQEYTLYQFITVQ